jgi:indolepyruvate ferredoxin oxidoreductase
VRFLTSYHDAAYAARYAAAVADVRATETRLGGAAAQALELTRAVAFHLARLMAIKDEYEVARLHTDPAFEQQLREQFDGWQRLVHHLAPPGPTRKGADGRPQKRAFGPWVRTAFTWLARARRLRGTWLDPFGHTQERRLERALVGEYLALLREVQAGLTPERLPLALRVARVPEHIRGYGHVKHAGVVAARALWASLMQAWHDNRLSEAALPEEARMPGGPSARPARVIPVRAE